MGDKNQAFIIKLFVNVIVSAVLGTIVILVILLWRYLISFW